MVAIIAGQSLRFFFPVSLPSQTNYMTLSKALKHSESQSFDLQSGDKNSFSLHTSQGFYENLAAAAAAVAVAATARSVLVSDSVELHLLLRLQSATQKPQTRPRGGLPGKSSTQTVWAQPQPIFSLFRSNKIFSNSCICKNSCKNPSKLELLKTRHAGASKSQLPAMNQSLRIPVTKARWEFQYSSRVSRASGCNICCNQCLLRTSVSCTEDPIWYMYGKFTKE